MPLTKHRSGVTIITEDIANSWYGGLFGTTAGNALGADNPLVAGHIHDGEHLDGHAQKINLLTHVTGQLDGANIVDGTITADKLAEGVGTGNSVAYQYNHVIQAAVLPDTDSNIFQFAIGETETKVFTFTALEDLTLNYLVFGSDYNNVGSVQDQTIMAGALIITRIEVVSGTGPNVGTDLISGGGLYGSYLTLQNIGRMPALSLDMEDGDILEIEVSTNIPTQITLPVNISGIYERGLSADNPLRVITLAGADQFIDLVTRTTAPSTGTLTVNSVPTAGQTFILSHNVNSFYGITTQQTYGGTLTAVAGARVGGSLTFSIDSGTVTGVRDEILTMLGDNPSTTFWTPSSSGADQVDFVVANSDNYGPVPNGAVFVGSDDSSITTTGMSGGAIDRVTATFAQAPVNCEIVTASISPYFFFDGNYQEEGFGPSYQSFKTSIGPFKKNGTNMPLGVISTLGNSAVVSVIDGNSQTLLTTDTVTASAFCPVINLAFAAIFARGI